jgi:ethanolamine utilization microcompartment shell protein EutL
MASFTREQMLEAIRERVNQDPEFRAQLMAQPRAALSEMLGMPIPDAVNIAVYEESPTEIHLVIPADSSLNEADLELVAGGKWGDNLPSYCSCAP